MLIGTEMPFPLIIICCYKLTEVTQKSGKEIGLRRTKLSSELLEFGQVTCVQFLYNM